MVWSAALWPGIAVLRGATVVQVNPEATELDQTARYKLRGKAAVVLPRLVEALLKGAQ